MKVLISFVSGIIVCGILVFSMRTALPTRAQNEVEADNLTTTSENLTGSLVSLIPDIEKIYRDSLTAPFIKAREKIHDEDIAEFYDELLDRTVLNDQQTE